MSRKYVFGKRGHKPGEFQQPNDIAIDDDGRIYVADLQRIQVFTASINAELNIEFQYENQFVVTCPEYKQEIWSGTSCIVYNSRHGELILPVVYKACGLAARTIQFRHIDGSLKHQFTNDSMASGLKLGVTSDDLVIVSDWTLHCLFVHQRDGVCVHKIQSGDNDSIEYPYFICVGREGDIIVSNYGQNNVLIFDKKFNFKYKFGKPGNKEGFVKTPTGLAVGGFGNIYVGEKDNKRIQLFTRDGDYVKCIGNTEDGLNSPKGMTLFDDSLYVVDNMNNDVKVFDIS